MSIHSRRRVLVVGGGYAGVRAARDVSRLARGDLEVVLVSASPWHVDRTSLYEVATVYRPRESAHSVDYVQQGVAVQLEELLAHVPVEVRQQTVTALRLTDRLAVLRDRTTLSFHYLVLALGAVPKTFGVPGVAQHTFSVGRLSEALRLRQHVVQQVLAAEHLSGEGREATMTFIIVGAGSTGVETAAELVGLLRKACRRRGFSSADYRVILIEAGATVLGDLSAHWQARVRARLEQLGVDVRLHTRVVAVESGGVRITDHVFIPSATVVWSTGLTADPLLAESGLPVADRGVKVNQFLQVVGQPMVFAAGDCAVRPGQTVPAMVSAAYQQGALVAENIWRQSQGQPLVPFHWQSPGQLVTLGGKKALIVFPSGRGYIGMTAWWIKQLVKLRYWLMYLLWPRALWLTWRALKVQSAND